MNSAKTYNENVTKLDLLIYLGMGMRIKKYDSRKMVNWSWIINLCFVAPFEIPHCEQKTLAAKFKKYLVYLGLISTQQLFQKISRLLPLNSSHCSYTISISWSQVYDHFLNTLVIKIPSIPKHQQWEPDRFIIFQVILNWDT